MRNPSVCREYLENLLAYIREQGISDQQLQRVLGFKPEDQLTEHERYPLRLFELTLDAAAQLLNDYFVGARAGAHGRRDAWGMVNYLGMSASDTRGAISIVEEFSRLLVDHGDLRLSDNGSEVAALVWDLPPQQTPSRQVVEFFFTSWYSVNKPLLDRWCVKREIHFSHEGPADCSVLEHIIEAPVNYGSHSNRVEFDSHFLDRPTRFPHSAIHQSLIQVAREEQRKLHLEDRIINGVIECIVKQLPEGVPRLEDVAAEMKLAPRTLQRRLSYTETNFKSLVDEVRKDRSKKLIVEDELGLLDISSEVGFSDQSAFQKAFKRWFGQTPGRYRQSMEQARDLAVA